MVVFGITVTVIFGPHSSITYTAVIMLAQCTLTLTLVLNPSLIAVLVSNTEPESTSILHTWGSECTSVEMMQ